MSTTSDKIRAHFRRFPNADVAKAAQKFNTAKARIYKLRKEVHEDIANGLRREEEKALRMPDLKLPITMLNDELGPVGDSATWTASTTDAGDIVATLTERGKRYGKFTGHAKVTQELKRVLWNALADKPILADDQQEALDMICHKLGRIVNGDPNYADSWVDIAGYAKLVSDRLEGVER